jgi:creatinine amidohydrolase/Fe(II)-dependent formamide hydrolase-like protein
MSPRHATRTSFAPKEREKFTTAIKISLHAGEKETVSLLAAESSMTPSEWARQAVREKMEEIGNARWG